MVERQKKEQEVKNPEYLHKLTDDQIYEYIFQEIRKNLPDPELPLILTTKELGPRDKKIGAYYATVGKIVREGDCVYQNTKITYEKQVYVRGLQGGGFILNLKISDYDCVNTAPTRSEPHPNETWVDYVDNILKDKGYREKAEKYMKTTYPEFYEKRKKGPYIYWDDARHDVDEKPSIRI